SRRSRASSPRRAKFDEQKAMKISELRATLAARGVNPRSFSIGEDRKDEEQYRLEESRGLWTISYRERGNTNDIRWCATEDEACRYFLDLLLKDPTTRR